MGPSKEAKIYSETVQDRRLDPDPSLIKPPSSLGIIIGILIFRYLKGRGFINQGFTLGGNCDGVSSYLRLMKGQSHMVHGEGGARKPEHQDYP